MTPFLVNKAIGRAIRKKGMIKISSLLTIGIAMFFSAAKAQAATFYVSPSGNNTDGTSWQTAWSELDQIKWKNLHSKDQIQIDGGTSSITYSTTLTVPASAPFVNIMQSSQGGHAGTVIIDGTHNTSGIGINMIGAGYFSGNGSFTDNQTQGLVIQNFANEGVRINNNASALSSFGRATLRSNKFGIYVTGLSSAPVVNIFGCIFKDCSNAGILVAENSAATISTNWFFNTSAPSSAHTYAGVRGISGAISNCVFGPELNYGLLENAATAPVSFAGNSGSGLGWSCQNSLFIDAQKANISLSNTSGATLSTPQSFQSLTLYLTPLNAMNQAHANILSNVGPGNIAVGNSVVYGGVINVPTADGVIASHSGPPNYEFNCTGNLLTLASTQLDPHFSTTALYSLPNNVSPATLIGEYFSVSASPTLGSSETSVLGLLLQLGYKP
jgi:hypothetical protein